MRIESVKLVLLSALLFGSLSIVEAKTEKQTVTFSVAMHCENCKKKIERNLAYEKGVLDLETNLKANTVTVTYDTAKTDVKKLTEALKKIGFEATVR